MREMREFPQLLNELLLKWESYLYSLICWLMDLTTFIPFLEYMMSWNTSSNLLDMEDTLVSLHFIIEPKLFKWRKCSVSTRSIGNSRVCCLCHLAGIMGYHFDTAVKSSRIQSQVWWMKEEKTYGWAYHLLICRGKPSGISVVCCLWS